MRRARYILYMVTCLLMLGSGLRAQQYTGTSGLIHVPSAEMDAEGDARVGTHFINQEMLPPVSAFTYGGEKYHTFSYYLSITPFWWMEIGYTCTLFRDRETSHAIGGYGQKDRYFSLKLAPIKEGKWWPAIAVGGNDFWDSRTTASKKSAELYFGNYYIAATKHLNFLGNELGFNLAYRQYRRDENAHWEGLVGGITYRPAFANNLRAIVEYTGNEVNVGLDCQLFRYFLVQASLQDGKYPSAGICLRVNLF